MGHQCVAEVNVWQIVLAILFALPRLVVILQQMHVDAWFVRVAVYRHLLHYANLQKINTVILITKVLPADLLLIEG